MSCACILNGKRMHAIICIVTTILLTLVFLVLITVWALVRTTSTIPQGSSMCIPCDKMMSKTYQNSGQKDDHLAIKMRDDGMCCGPAESIAQMLLQKDMVEQFYEYRKNSAGLLDILDDSVLADCQMETSNKQPVSKIVGVVEFKPSYIVRGHYKLLKPSAPILRIIASTWNSKEKYLYDSRATTLFLRN
ncbi:uncharacterized protein LOC128244577 [Mya arenaria]|uniref:uncharacterized protein LOC128244577 n=1 Tax=Mya arenaria TaxID=6604 RepID=UPI0022E862EA|nr:uncharacterized protein LOC128244577 [Mya arenaria]XP_052818528.1 uncharacterized protein LOC128244577 [Mya arenaria]XP_052818529.1 uncharacterized protein LOC128244577 [Mya arenaria]